MAKKKMSMYQTFKTAVFNPIIVGGKEISVMNIVNDRLFINGEYCDLRIIKERHNPEIR